MLRHMENGLKASMWFSHTLYFMLPEDHCKKNSSNWDCGFAKSRRSWLSSKTLQCSVPLERYSPRDVLYGKSRTEKRGAGDLKLLALRATWMPTPSEKCQPGLSETSRTCRRRASSESRGSTARPGNISVSVTSFKAFEVCFVNSALYSTDQDPSRRTRRSVELSISFVPASTNLFIVAVHLK
jgi:hypothetical protein